MSGMWLGTQLCQGRINRRIAGEDIHWLEYVIRKYITPGIQAAFDPAKLRCLVLGSNEGWMELKLAASGFIGEIVASDIADKALGRARARAAEAGYGNIRHQLADLNRDCFEGSFDFIVCEGVLHHIVEIESCLRMLSDRLQPSGLMFAVEFEGPFRFQLPDKQVRWINAALQTLPRGLRPLHDRTTNADYPATPEENESIYYRPPPESTIEQFDPTEAYSGPALKRLLPQFFDIVERTGFGGTLLSYMAGHFDFSRANSDHVARTWLEALCGIEDAVINSGILDDEFVFYVLRRRSEESYAPSLS